MQPNTTLMTLSITMLYTAFGIDLLKTLKVHWAAYRSALEKYPLLYVPALIFWLPIFIAYVLWPALEPLTKSRESDYQDNEGDQ